MRPAIEAAKAFHTVHGRSPTQVWSAPGRVNLIGEHTDYHNGFVLPFALTQRLAAAASARDDRLLRVATKGSDGRIQHLDPLEIPALKPGSVQGWGAYPAGIAWVLRDQGIDRGADLVLAGDVPTGAGLSSSAAVECAVALALLGLTGQPEPDQERRRKIARWAQQAENEFVGVPTGVLDQTASLCCTQNHALFLDVESGDSEQVPFDIRAEDLGVLVIDTRVKHAHSSSGYRDRRRATEQAAKLLGVEFLREVEVSSLSSAVDLLPEEFVPLVRHVVTENQRVIDMVDLLKEKRLGEIGPLLDASHESLRWDYRVSCEELDVAVETARDAGAWGARMTGGGFGGSAIALVPLSAATIIKDRVIKAFVGRNWQTPKIFLAEPSAGAGRESDFLC